MTKPLPVKHPPIADIRELLDTLNTAHGTSVSHAIVPESLVGLVSCGLMGGAWIDVSRTKTRVLNYLLRNWDELTQQPKPDAEMFLEDCAGRVGQENQSVEVESPMYQCSKCGNRLIFTKQGDPHENQKGCCDDSTVLTLSKEKDDA